MNFIDEKDDVTKDLIDELFKPVSFSKCRHTLNLTQAALAPLLGVSLKSIKNYEQGIRTPPESVLMLLKLELEK